MVEGHIGSRLLMKDCTEGVRLFVASSYPHAGTTHPPRIERRQYLSLEEVNCQSYQNNHMEPHRGKGTSRSALALSKLGLAPPPGAKYDNFFAPHNEDFYSKLILSS